MAGAELNISGRVSRDAAAERFFKIVGKHRAPDDHKRIASRAKKETRRLC
jgi:hypothetical protein